MCGNEREILDTAQTVLIEEGYESLSMHAIADPMDIADAEAVPKRSCGEYDAISSLGSMSSLLQKSR